MVKCGNEQKVMCAVHSFHSGVSVKSRIAEILVQNPDELNKTHNRNLFYSKTEISKEYQRTQTVFAFPDSGFY